MNLEIIVNVWVAMFLYNVVFKAFGASLLSAFVKNETVQKEIKSKNKTFQERLKEEQDKNHS